MIILRRLFDVGIVAIPLMVVTMVSAMGAADAAGAQNGKAEVRNPYMGKQHAITIGRQLYARHCMVCHGTAGGRGPDLFENKLTDREFLQTVLGGKSGSRGQMPSWGGRLAVKQIWYIEAFVKSASHF